MRHGEAVFVDSGAWIALALSRDPLHPQAREQWNLLHKAGAKLHTSIPVLMETFTFTRSQGGQARPGQPRPMPGGLRRQPMLTPIVGLLYGCEPAAPHVVNEASPERRHT
jgi:hypothetical protein